MLDPGNHVHDSQPDAADRLALAPLPKRKAFLAPHTRELLAQRAAQDEDAHTRGAAFSALGEMHSEFGRILPTRDLDGILPYLDPLDPISRQHIESAAAKARIRPDDVEAQLSSLSAHLGWDVTSGVKMTTGNETGRRRLGHRRRR